MSWRGRERQVGDRYRSKVVAQDTFSSCVRGLAQHSLQWASKAIALENSGPEATGIGGLQTPPPPLHPSCKLRPGAQLALLLTLCLNPPAAPHPSTFCYRWSAFGFPAVCLKNNSSPPSAREMKCVIPILWVETAQWPSHPREPGKEGATSVFEHRFFDSSTEGGPRAVWSGLVWSGPCTCS